MFYFHFILVALILVVLPVDTVNAIEPGGFLDCNGPDCSACNLVEMVNLIIVWLFGIVAFIFVVMMTVAGFGLVTSGGDTAALSAAKEKFKNVIIGLIIVMAAWLLVDSLMRGLLIGGSGEIQGWGPWSSVQCFEQITPEKGELADIGGTPPDETMTAECTDDAALMAKYGGSPVGVNAPGLQTMINCYKSDPTVASLLSSQAIYTHDLTNPRCSLTNGNTVCGKCSHSNNSKHYGRGSGLGSSAADFNASSNEYALRDALKNMQSTCGGTILFEGSHTHISL